MTHEYRRQIFAEFLGPLGVVLLVFSVAAFWPVDGASTSTGTSGASGASGPFVEVAMPSALGRPAAASVGEARAVPGGTGLPSDQAADKAGIRPPAKRDRAVTTINAPAVVLEQRS